MDGNVSGEIVVSVEYDDNGNMVKRTENAQVDQCSVELGITSKGDLQPKVKVYAADEIEAARRAAKVLRSFVDFPVADAKALGLEG